MSFRRWDIFNHQREKTRLEILLQNVRKYLDNCNQYKGKDNEDTLFSIHTKLEDSLLVSVSIRQPAMYTHFPGPCHTGIVSKPVFSSTGVHQMVPQLCKRLVWTGAVGFKHGETHNDQTLCPKRTITVLCVEQRVA